MTCYSWKNVLIRVGSKYNSISKTFQVCFNFPTMFEPTLFFQNILQPNTTTYISGQKQCLHSWREDALLQGLIPGQPKICYPWGKFPGIKPKNLPAAFGGRKFFSPALSPQGTNSKIFFTHGIPICYSQGSFQKKNSPPLTPQGSFSEKFEIFGPFLAKLGGE